MYEQKRLVLDKNVVVAESSLLRRERKDRYGSVPGLDDSELADPGELDCIGICFLDKSVLERDLSMSCFVFCG
jgi:hypothetical protein